MVSKIKIEVIAILNVILETIIKINEDNKIIEVVGAITNKINKIEIKEVFNSNTLEDFNKIKAIIKDKISKIKSKIEDRAIISADLGSIVIEEIVVSSTHQVVEGMAQAQPLKGKTFNALMQSGCLNPHVKETAVKPMLLNLLACLTQ